MKDESTHGRQGSQAVKDAVKAPVSGKSSHSTARRPGRKPNLSRRAAYGGSLHPEGKGIPGLYLG